MAVAWVSKISNRVTTGVATTITLANVVGSGGNVVVAFFDWRLNGEAMTGATYGGAAMTRVTGFPFAVDEIGQDAFYTLNPSGTQNVVGTWDSAPQRIYGHAHVLSGADVGGTPFGTLATQQGTGTQMSSSLSVTTIVNGMVLDNIMVRQEGTLTPEAAQTKRSEEETAGTENTAVSTKPADATTETVFWTWVNSEAYHVAAIPVNPVSAVTPYLLVAN